MHGIHYPSQTIPMMNEGKSLQVAISLPVKEFSDEITDRNRRKGTQRSLITPIIMPSELLDINPLKILHLLNCSSLFPVLCFPENVLAPKKFSATKKSRQ